MCFPSVKTPKAPEIPPAPPPPPKLEYSAPPTKKASPASKTKKARKLEVGKPAVSGLRAPSKGSGLNYNK
jgi:hypothetical protein